MTASTITRTGTRTSTRPSFLADGAVAHTLIATFATRAAAAEAGLDLVAYARPLSVDLLDRAALHAVSEFAGLDLGWDAEAVVLATLSDDANLHAVSRYFATYNLVNAPVVDAQHRLIGAITVDDVLDHVLPDDWRGAQLDLLSTQPPTVTPEQVGRG